MSDADEYDYGSDADDGYDYGSEMGDAAEEANADEVAIENAYYEGDDSKKSDPALALEHFGKVVALEAAAAPSSSEWRVKAYREMFRIQLRLGQSSEALQSYKNLLEMAQNLTANARTDALRSALDSAVASQDDDFVCRIYNVTLDDIADVTSRAYAATALDLARYLAARGSSTRLRSLLLEKFQILGPNDDGTLTPPSLAPAQRLELLSLKIDCYSASRDFVRTRRAYAASLELCEEAIQDPRVMGSVRDVGGDIRMSEASYDSAFDEYFASFRCHQEVGDVSAKSVLKKAVVAATICGAAINPFDSREARAYLDDPEILALSEMKQCCDANDVAGFLAQLAKASLADHPYAGILAERVRLNALVHYTAPFKRVSVAYLAEKVCAPAQQTREYLAALVASKRTPNFALDLCGDEFVDVSTIEDPVMASLKAWTLEISDATSRIVCEPSTISKVTSSPRRR